MLRILLILLSASFELNAASCFFGKELEKKYNAKYSHLFEVSTTLQDGSFDVSVSIPKSIEGSEFENATLLKGSEEAPSLFTILKPIEVEGITKVWFVAESSPNETYYLGFNYGSGCGFSVTIPVVLDENITSR